uniref:Uncharacterized protein n=1 Tax=Caenorhabditis japonica TaxID=281687 RepID=A0A8R1EP47_CAEJA
MDALLRKELERLERKNGELLTTQKDLREDAVKMMREIENKTNQLLRLENKRKEDKEVYKGNLKLVTGERDGEHKKTKVLEKKIESLEKNYAEANKMLLWMERKNGDLESTNALLREQIRASKESERERLRSEERKMNKETRRSYATLKSNQYKKKRLEGALESLESISG